jgi:hypothetical protein
MLACYHSKAIEQSRRQLTMRQEDIGQFTAGSSTIRGQHTELANAEPIHFDTGNADPVASATSILDVPTRKTFRDLFPQPQTTPLMSAGAMLYEDTMKFRVS